MPLGSLSTGSYYYPTVSAFSTTVKPASNVQSLSSTFTTGSIGSSGGATVLGPINVSAYNAYTITLINYSVNNLISGAIQLSVDGNTWTTISTQFNNLTSSGLASASFVDRADRFVRVLCMPSGAAGGFTGSIDAYIVMHI